MPTLTGEPGTLMLKKGYTEEYHDLRRKGLKVKGWWFHTKTKQIFKELYPDETFHFSNCWFTGKCFYRTTQNEVKSGDLVGPLGKFELKQSANVGQTPLPFTVTYGTMYEDTGASSIWVRGGASGLDKRQCTVQLIIFADGESRVKPLIIFWGKGKQITFREKVHYDCRVHVAFQVNS